MHTFSELWGVKRPPITGRRKVGSQAIGIEIELEQVYLKTTPTHWKTINDGSLKDKGKEFTLAVWDTSALDELKHLYSFFEIKPKTTKRTSVHIHVDLTEFTEEQLTTLIKLYIIFERTLFRYTGKRNNNNFCVPVQDRVITTLTSESFPKYSAIHLFPRTDNGDNLCTLEFRHLTGTTNIKLIHGWIKIIGDLTKAAKEISLEELNNSLYTMRTKQEYWQLIERVFPKTIDSLNYTGLEDDVEKGITFIKCIR